MSGYRSGSDVERRVAQRSSNLTIAGVFLVLSGVLSVIQGVIALASDTYFTVSRESIFDFDITVWGWAQLIGGVLVLVTGIAVLQRMQWARPAAVVLAAISMAAAFLWFPGHVFWSMLVIAVDGLVMGAVLAPGVFERDD